MRMLRVLQEKMELLVSLNWESTNPSQHTLSVMPLDQHWIRPVMIGTTKTRRIDGFAMILYVLNTSRISCDEHITVYVSSFMLKIKMKDS